MDWISRYAEMSRRGLFTTTFVLLLLAFCLIGPLLCSHFDIFFTFRSQNNSISMANIFSRFNLDWMSFNFVPPFEQFTAYYFFKHCIRRLF